MYACSSGLALPSSCLFSLGHPACFGVWLLLFQSSVLVGVFVKYFRNSCHGALKLLLCRLAAKAAVAHGWCVLLAFIPGHGGQPIYRLHIYICAYVSRFSVVVLRGCQHRRCIGHVLEVAGWSAVTTMM